MPTVLLVEDDEQERDIYKTLLYYNGFDVLTAVDGQSGIKEAVTNKPDVILVDVMLPGVNGIHAAQRISQNAETAHIPIICMSAYDISSHLVRHSGAREFLPKPVKGDVLVRTIRRYIGWQNEDR